MSDQKSLSTPEAASPFASLSELKSASDTLLRRFQEQTTSVTSRPLGSSASEDLIQAARELIARGKATGIRLVAQNDRWAAQNLLDYWVTVFYREKQSPPDATLEDYNPDLAPTLPKEACPYLGLEGRIEGQPELYYGRKSLTDEMVERLGRRPGLLAIVGPEDGDKGLIVLGGLLTELREQDIRETPGLSWRYLPIISPGMDPLTNLVRTIAPPGTEVSHDPVKRQVQALRKDPGRLLKLLAEGGSEPAILVVDRFEECLGRNDPETGIFIDCLIAMARCAEPAHVVILIMRTDTTHRAAKWEALDEVLNEALVVVPPLGAAELRRAIHDPAEVVGLHFEDGLVERIVQDLLGEPAGMPLLQFTMLELWDRLEGNLVRWKDYQQLGSPREAVAARAEKLYGDLADGARSRLRQFLLDLARPGIGGEVVLRRLPIQSLPDAILPGTMDLVRCLKDARLVRIYRRTGGLLRPGQSPSPDDLIELGHEALVSNWPRAVEWMELARYQDRQLRLLKAANELWHEHGKDPGGLLAGSLLDDALRLLDEGKLEPPEKEFVLRSREFRDQLQQRREEDQRRKVRNLRIGIASLLTLLLATAGLLFYVWRARSELARKHRELVETQTNLSLKNIALQRTEDDLTKKNAALLESQNQLSATNNELVTAHAELKAKMSELTQAQKDLSEKNTVLNQKNELLNRTLEEQYKVLSQIGSTLVAKKSPLSETLSAQLSNQITSLSRIRSKNEALQSQGTGREVVSPKLAREPRLQGQWRLWQNGATLRVRYLDGDERLKKLVQQYAPEWSQHANLHFVFGSQDSDAEIRVTFQQPGSWSALGIDALTWPSDQPTMNLGMLRNTASERDAARVIRHEFGHVLGLIHELQNPNAEIHWNVQAVIDYYSRTQGWDRSMIESTILTKHPPFHNPEYRPFDPLSIMTFPIPEGLATWGNGQQLKTDWNMQLSESDKAFVSRLYPKPR